MTSMVVPHSQDLSLAWTPMPAADLIKRNAKADPVEAKDAKKRHRHQSDDGDNTPIKRERKLSDASLSHSDDNASGAHDEPQSPNDDYKWPALARKRQRMTEHERKARHREVQRQFMQRKLAKLDEMRKLVVVLEKQYALLQVSQERARLEHEHDYLHRRVLMNPSHWRHEHPHDVQRRLNAMHMPPPPPALPPMRHGSQPHHPHHANLPHHRAPTGMLPWDEILEAVSEANV